MCMPSHHPDTRPARPDLRRHTTQPGRPPRTTTGRPATRRPGAAPGTRRARDGDARPRRQQTQDAEATGGFTKVEFAVARSFLGDSSEPVGGGRHGRSQALPVGLVDVPVVRPTTGIAVRHVRGRLFCVVIHDHVKAWDQFKRDEAGREDGAPSADIADEALSDQPVREDRLWPASYRNVESRSQGSVIARRSGNRRCWRRGGHQRGSTGERATLPTARTGHLGPSSQDAISLPLGRISRERYRAPDHPHNAGSRTGRSGCAVNILIAG